MPAQLTRSKQHWVLRMLYAHRYLDVGQIAALVSPTSSRRACQACCTTLHRKGYVHRFEFARGGLGGGRTSYVYTLAPAGAQALAEADGIPVVDIPVDPDGPTARSVFVHHQLAANRCLVAVLHATGRSPGTHLRQWTSDPHSRLRCYRPAGARFWGGILKRCDHGHAGAGLHAIRRVQRGGLRVEPKLQPPVIGSDPAVRSGGQQVDHEPLEDKGAAQAIHRHPRAASVPAKARVDRSAQRFVAGGAHTDMLGARLSRSRRHPVDRAGLRVSQGRGVWQRCCDARSPR